MFTANAKCGQTLIVYFASAFTVAKAMASFYALKTYRDCADLCFGERGCQQRVTKYP